MKKLLLPALAAVCLILAAHAEVLIYDLSFNTVGPSVNYSFLEGGYLNASESVSTDTNNITTITYGFAGSSKVGANYQSGLTKDANNRRLDTTSTLDNLAAILRNRGIVPQPTATPLPTATPQ